MGAAASTELYVSKKQRQQRKLLKLPPELADVRQRRIENQELDVQFNKQSATHAQAEYGGYSSNPLDQWLGLAKKPLKNPDEDSSSKGKTADWDDPKTKVRKRTEIADDQSGYMTRLTCDHSAGTAPTVSLDRASIAARARRWNHWFHHVQGYWY